jgi:hypothetical protein
MKIHSLWMNVCGFGLTALGTAVLLSAVAARAPAVDWESVAIQPHQDYQAIYDAGLPTGWTTDYQGGFPLRLRGVVLNANEDWLDPTAAYDPGYHPYQTGGQAEFFVQTVAPTDFGGTFCWMGQNYGNMPWIQTPLDNYTNAQWYAELNRLHLWHPAGAGLPNPLPYEQIIRPGDEVEIRARGGMYYSGKMNVNEQHSNNPNMDFEVVVLQWGRGWDAPVNLTLADLKHPDNTLIFNTSAPRESGGEHYQGSLVTLQNVHLQSGTWGANKDVVVADTTGRTFGVHLSFGAGFSAYGAPAGTFNVTGTMDQASSTGDGGYRVLAMDSGDLFKRWANAPGSGSWNDAANWTSGGSVPTAGEGIHFGGSGGGTATNDFTPGQAVGGIEFEPDAGPFTLEGNAVALAGDLVSFSPNTQTVSMEVAITGQDTTFYAAAGDLVLEHELENNVYLRKIGAGTVAMPRGIHGSGSLHVSNGVLTASSIVQDALIIGGADTSEGDRNFASDVKPVPEPSCWALLLSAGLLGGWFLFGGRKKFGADFHAD